MMGVYPKPVVRTVYCICWKMRLRPRHPKPYVMVPHRQSLPIQPKYTDERTESRVINTERLAAYSAQGSEIDAGAIARAAELLRAGKLVAFPTETVYGLGANALSPDAVARIFEAKGRPANNPVIVHVAEVAEARALTSDWPEIADRLAAVFWPGPLTLVLPRSDRIPDIVTAGGPTVALRIPSHPVALALLRAAGIPIAAPSANRSMLLSPTTAEHVLQSLEGRIDALLDGGPTTGGIESTVILLTGERPRLLRPGLISPAQIEAIVGPIDRNGPSNDQNPELEEGTATRNSGGESTDDGAEPKGEDRSAEALASPGMMARHYAPRAPLEVSGDGELRVRQQLKEGHKVGWLTRSRNAPIADMPARLVRLEMPPDAPGYAARLYAALHSLDDQGVTRIVADKLPPTDEWLALRDRLRRASTPEV